MPILEFECKVCKNIFEVIVLSNNDKTEEQTCPTCGGKTKQIISSSNFILCDSGVGWARDGYSRRPNGTKSKNNRKDDSGTTRKD